MAPGPSPSSPHFPVRNVKSWPPLPLLSRDHWGWSHMPSVNSQPSNSKACWSLRTSALSLAGQASEEWVCLETLAAGLQLGEGLEWPKQNSHGVLSKASANGQGQDGLQRWCFITMPVGDLLWEPVPALEAHLVAFTGPWAKSSISAFPFASMQKAGRWLNPITG